MSEPKIDIEKLIEEALEPCVWKDHAVKDLMKFWDKPEIIILNGGLFPAYIINERNILPENCDEWLEELKKTLLDSITVRLIEPEYNFVWSHSRMTYAVGIIIHMTGDSHYLKVCRKGTLRLQMLWKEIMACM